MTLHASSWASYELDDTWIDETAHVLRRVAADGTTESIVVHCDPAGAGMTAAQYAERQQVSLAESLPGFTIQRSSPYLLDGRDAHELVFGWSPPGGPIEQVQVHISGPGGMIVFTVTEVPRLGPQGRAAFTRMLASARIPAPTP